MWGSFRLRDTTEECRLMGNTLPDSNTTHFLPVVNTTTIPAPRKSWLLKPPSRSIARCTDSSTHLEIQAHLDDSQLLNCLLIRESCESTKNPYKVQDTINIFIYFAFAHITKKKIPMEQDSGWALIHKHEHVSSRYSRELSWTLQQRQESRFSLTRPQLMSLYRLNITVKGLIMCYNGWIKKIKKSGGSVI